MKKINRDVQSQVLRLCFFMSFVIIFSAPAFSMPVVDSLYANIKDQAIASLRDTFNRPIKIREATGVVVGQIVLNDVAVGKDLHFDKFIINFNPISYAYHKGDIMPAINDIKIEGGWANAIREKNGHFNLSDIMKTGKDGGPPFKAKISFEGINILFKDSAGMPYKNKEIQTKILEASGTANLKKFPKIALAIFAKTEENGPIDIKGSLDAKRSIFDITVHAKHLKASTFGNYFIPFVDLKEGFADASAVIKSNDIRINVDGLADDVRFNVYGKVFDRLDLRVNLKNARISKFKKFIPGLEDLDLDGLVDSEIKLSGPFKNIKAGIVVKAENERFAQLKWSGRSSLVFANSKLSVLDSALRVYKGNIKVSGDILFSEKIPNFNLSGGYSNLDIPEFVQQAPGFVGSINGDFAASGNIEKFTTQLKGGLSRASIFGQSVKAFKGNVQYDNGSLIFDDIKLSSDLSEFVGSGAMTPQKEFNIKANAAGLRLSGKGVVGQMEIGVNKFTGELSFRLDDKFISAPLKNLTASGSVEIMDGFVGNQKIAYGIGDINLANGRIEVKDFKVREGKSSISLSGITGFGVDTDLKISGDQVELSDLKILNYLFPSSSITLQGLVDIKLSANGNIDKINSVEDLEKLGLSAKLFGRNIRVGNTYLNAVSIEANVSDGRVFFDSFYVNTNRSDITGYLKKDRARFLGYLNLDDVRFLTSQYGDISGSANLDFWMAGDPQDPTSNLTVDLSNFSYNKVKLDRLYGSIGLYQKKLDILKPIIIISGENQLNCTGYAVLDLADLSQSNLKIKTELVKGNIKEVLRLGAGIYQEADRLITPVFESSAMLDPSMLKLPARPTNVLYKKDGDSPYFYKAWDGISQDLQNYSRSTAPILFDEIKGSIVGKAEIGGQLGAPTVQAFAGIKNGGYGRYEFEKLEASFTVSSESLKIDKCELSKQDGKTSVTGEINFPEQNISLKLFSKEMPIDMLKLVIDREFQGRFNAIGFISGPFADPGYSVQLKTSKIKLSGIDYDMAEGSLSHSPGYFSFNGLKLYNGKKISQFDGSISSDGDIDLLATLEGNSLGIINLFTHELRWINGTASGIVSLVKNKDNFLSDGHLTIKDALINVGKAGADIAQGEMDVSFEGNVISLNKLTGYWYGKQGAPTQISLAGNLDTYNQTFALRSLDGSYNVDIRDFYRGDINLKDMYFYGSYNKPVISGKINLHDGLLSLPNAAPNKNGSSSKGAGVGLNIELNIPKNVYLIVGNLDTVDLSNIFMNLEMTGEKIQVSGDTSNPGVFGRIFFKRGTINLFNREFSLLSQDAQKEIYRNNLDKISENYAEFTGELLPKLDLKAKVDVEDIYAENTANPSSPAIASSGTDQSIPEIKKQILIVSRLQGIPQSSNKDKALKIGFEAFHEDKTTSPASYKHSGHSEDQVKVLLLPDFIKTAMGVNRGSAIDSNAVVADYLNSRIQTYVFRGIERELEKTLGLESLTLEYNFGKDLRRALGAKDISRAQAQTLGVGFVKGFFDRFYINVKYSQLMEEVGASEKRTYINYQLTYRLTAVLSISYYREPVSINDIVSGYYKTSLNAQYAF